MYPITRRTVLSMIAATPLSFLLRSRAAAQGTSGFIRYDARSPNGKAMLKKYATAVTMMKTRPPGDPLSWVFQWYTHGVPNGKDAEIARIFPAVSPAKDLASAAWETCQAHHPGDNEDFFLPWHRLYVLFFEKIIRTVLSDQTFTLPYWDYTAADPAIHGVLPAEFRSPGDSAYQSLFVQNRNPGVNAGKPIQGNGPEDPLNLDDLTASSYSGDFGFCNSLDMNLHGTVHVLVGTGTNMGSIPFAANDPIFWLHHCNIDRLWASWNATGHSNPGLAQLFAFADGAGNRADADVGSVLDLAAMDYKYDRLENVPGAPPAEEAVAASAKTVASTRKSSAAPAEPIRLGADRVKITLNMLAPSEGQKARAFPEHVRALAPEHKLTVLLKGLKAEAAPGVVYNVYLDLPDKPTREQFKLHYLGTLNFFDAVGHGHHDDEAADGKRKPIPLRATKVAKTLREKGLLSEKPTIVIIPQGKPAEEAKPSIAEVQILEH